jgi:endo-1,4-beta-xylanase
MSIPMAPQLVVVDGDLDEWRNFPTMPAPFMDRAAEPLIAPGENGTVITIYRKTSQLRLAWKASGLYGAMEIRDDQVQIDPQKPWNADSVEIFIEKDFARSAEATEATGQVILSPDLKTGRCEIWTKNISPDGIVAVCKATDGGYRLEFFIMAPELRPAEMRADVKLGLNVAQNNDGTPVWQLFSDKSGDGFRQPDTWGAVVLGR